MAAHNRRMLIVSASVLLVAIAATAAVLTFTATPRSSTAEQGSANAGSSAPDTTAHGANTAYTPRPSTTSPAASPGASSAAPSAASPRKPAPVGSTVVRVSKLARVEVVTTFAGWNDLSHAVEVGGYAAVVEPVGACTLRLSLGDRVVTRKHAASTDATTVACGGFSVPRTELAAGDWRAVLGYKSAKSAGESATVMVKVP